MILVFGRTGQVASELRQLAPDARFLGHEEADLANPDACAHAIRELRPRCVINAAAYTTVDKAETESELAHVINADAPGAMARACHMIGVPLVHVSTDYVFDGSGTEPRGTDAATAPINAYGRSKLAGEEAVRASGAVHAIVRTSWVFSEHGQNFVKTMVGLAANHRKLSVVSDQVGGPTPAAAIAEACLVIAQALVDQPQLSGTYHLSGTPDVSWADFARAIFAEMEAGVEVTDIPTADYPRPAARPLNSRLDCGSLSLFGLQRPHWRPALGPIIKSMEQS